MITLIIRILLVIGLLSSCTSDRDQQLTTDEPVSQGQSAASQPKVDDENASEFTAYFEQQNRDDSLFTSQAEEFLLAIPTPTASETPAGAALAIGIVKLTLRSNEESNDDKEVLLDQDKTISASVSLEALTLERKFDLAEAIRRNPLLNNLEFFKLCLKALKVSDNSAGFTVAINSAIAAKINARDGGAITQDDSTNDQEYSNAENNRLSVERSLSDVRFADSLLWEAQIMADSRHFQEAIDRIRKVQPENPLYQIAQEKIVQVSDLAVKELRQKAAQAFQNSIPVNDPRARAAYLAKAKLHLEEALQNYPNAPADQLTTVRENLAVISRDLEKLEGGSTTSAQ